MFFKIFLLWACLVASQAQYKYGHGHKVEVKHEAPVHHKKLVLLPIQHEPKATISKSTIIKKKEVRQAPVHYAPVAVQRAPIYYERKEEEEYGHPLYKYEYHIVDPHTGDERSQSESREDEVVKGQYSFVQPDGQIRTVVYEVDKDSGFKAHVTYSDVPKHHGRFNSLN